MNKNSQSSRQHPGRRSLLQLFAACIAALSAAGCGSRVEIGDAKDGVSQSAGSAGLAGSAGSAGSGGSGPVLAGAPGTAGSAPEDCTAADANSRAVHDAWEALANQLGELVGKTFNGYVVGGPDLTLTVHADGNAELVVGQPAPPTADSSYLCGDGLQDGSQCWARYGYPPTDGAVYPFHGASFSAGRLLAPIQPASPYEAWCALQTPQETGVCYFQLEGNDPTSMKPSTGMCTLGSRSVDCGWLELAELGVCRCSSTACFAGVYAYDPNQPDNVQIDARLDAATHVLSGNLINGTRSQSAIYLVEASN
jgi:hypothetical protein